MSYRVPSCGRRQRPRELPLQAVLDVRPDRLQWEPVQHVCGKRANQQMPGCRVAQTTRAEIEQRVIIELPHRRAMRAPDVVREDLELRFRVDLRVLGQQECTIGLLCVGLLRVWPDDDLAVEDAPR